MHATKDALCKLHWLQVVTYNKVQSGVSEDIPCHWSFFGATKQHYEGLPVCPSVHV